MRLSGLGASWLLSRGQCQRGATIGRELPDRCAPFISVTNEAWHIRSHQLGGSKNEDVFDLTVVACLIGQSAGNESTEKIH